MVQLTNQSSMVKNEQQILADLNDLSNLQALNARLRATMSKEEINLLDEEIKSSEEDFN